MSDLEKNAQEEATKKHPYNLREKKEKKAAYRSLIRPELADELYDRILNIIERDGVKIGVLGLGCQLEGMVQANKCVGVVYNDPVATANEVAAVLKEKEGCDVVVCLSHLGVQYDENQLIPKTRNIDVVLGGHSHTFMKGPKTLLNMDGKNVSLMHTGKSGIYVGQMDLTLENKK